MAYQKKKPENVAYKKLLADLLHNNYPEIRFHDFRMVKGPTHTNIIFDIVVPFDYKERDDVITDFLQKEIHRIDSSYFAVIQVDKAYTGNAL